MNELLITLAAGVIVGLVSLLSERLGLGPTTVRVIVFILCLASGVGLQVYLKGLPNWADFEQIALFASAAFGLAVLVYKAVLARWPTVAAMSFEGWI